MFNKFSMKILREMAVGETRIFCLTSKGNGGQIHLAAKRAGGKVIAQNAVLIMGRDLETIEGLAITLVEALRDPLPKGRKQKNKD